ncbi:MAG TPA: hypothetical protein VMC48_02155 [Methanobacterium sp.]|nr:hypothetical protein [Methanobacterium sp.]
MYKDQKDLEELQEILILIYKLIKQEKLYEKFFFEDSELERPYKYKNSLINELLEMDDSIDFLEACIQEVEELKEGPERPINDIVEEKETELLLVKYGLAYLEEVDKLNIEVFREYL